MFFLLFARTCIIDLCLISYMLLKSGSFQNSHYRKGMLYPLLLFIFRQLLFTMSMSDELMYTVSGFSLTLDYFLWLRTENLSLRGVTLGMTALPQGVRRGESMGGKNSLIFLRGESAFSLIINKINYIKFCLNEHSQATLNQSMEMIILIPSTLSYFSYK